MAQAIEAPASTSAEGPTAYTQNQVPRFSPHQLRMLHGGINGNRVRMLRGMPHLEAWDVRRQLVRIFGFGGFSVDTIGLDLVAEREAKNGDRSRWTVVYRAQVRLTLFTPDGREITHFEDAAAGDSVNQPSLGDAHDMAMKTAVSQALKRCAVNLGDQFGLSLYNDGSREPVVNFSAAHPPQEWKKQAEPAQPEPDDPPVRPEPQAPTAPEDREAALARLTEQYRNCWSNPLALTQIRIEGKQFELSEERVQGPPPESAWTTFDALLETRIAELNSSNTEGSAA